MFISSYVVHKENMTEVPTKTTVRRGRFGSKQCDLFDGTVPIFASTVKAIIQTVSNRELPK